jgi:hypothetical protein
MEASIIVLGEESAQDDGAPGRVFIEWHPVALQPGQLPFVLSVAGERDQLVSSQEHGQ